MVLIGATALIKVDDRTCFPEFLILCSSMWRRTFIIHKIDYRLSKLQCHKIQFDSVLKTNNEFDWWTTLGSCPFYWERGPRQWFSRGNITSNGSTCQANINPYRYFEIGRWNWMEKITSYFNLHDLIRPGLWRRLRVLKRNYFDFELSLKLNGKDNLCAFQYHMI